METRQARLKLNDIAITLGSHLQQPNTTVQFTRVRTNASLFLSLLFFCTYNFPPPEDFNFPIPNNPIIRDYNYYIIYVMPCHMQISC